MWLGLVGVVLGLWGCGGDVSTSKPTDPSTDTPPIEDTAPPVGDTGAAPTTDTGTEPFDLWVALDAIEGLTVTDLTPTGADHVFLELVYEQPMDHADPSGGTFEQHMTLIHRDRQAPMVFVSTGYANFYWDYEGELAQLLAPANQIVVEKRFHGASEPASPDWSTMTIEQIATDHHRVIDALDEIYVGPWVSTGASLGGFDVTAHRRFFPDDVDGTVAYVAPFTFALGDTRYSPHFDAEVDPACQAGIEAVQIEILGPRRATMEALAAYTAGSYGLTFDRVGGVSAALESTVASLAWGFWQYDGSPWCYLVPPANGSDTQLYNFYLSFSPIWGASDDTIAYFDGYYYQAYAEVGFPQIPTDHLQGLINPGVDGYGTGLLPPGATPPLYDPTVVPDIVDWVNASGEDLLFIYGSEDPWTAGAIDLSAAVGDVRSFVAQGHQHGAAIEDLSAAEQAEVLAEIGTWTGAPPMARRRGGLLRRPQPPAAIIR